MAITDIIRTKRTYISFIRMEDFMTMQGRQRVFLPEHAHSVAKVYDFLEEHSFPERTPEEVQVFLSGQDSHDRVEIPAEIFEALKTIATVLSQGEAVTVESSSLRLTTQEAADLLNISRPTLIRLLEQGKIPYEKIGKHRKVLLSDLAAYQRSRFEEIKESLTFIGSPAFDAPATSADLKQARRVIAARRAAQRA